MVVLLQITAAPVTVMHLITVFRIVQVYGAVQLWMMNAEYAESQMMKLGILHVPIVMAW